MQATDKTMRQASGVLQTVFGYSDFRPGQRELVGAILSGRDALGIMPTGGGKSLCFQVPALLLPGVTLVLSPLISLMKDQVDALRENGVAAAFINSTLSERAYFETMEDARSGRLKLIYIAPERLEAPGFQALLSQLTVSLVAVDEAHCISQWGHDFRPSYLTIGSMLAAFATRPIVAAFTATATERVRDDIVRELALRAPELVNTGYDRPNLLFRVEQPADRTGALIAFAQQRADESGVVSCATRKAVEQVCDALRAQGVAATRYHAGLSEDERRRNQDQFISDQCGVMVATNAFGMGIDKSNIRYVAHFNMPKTMEAYYQEAGRAGRDGQPAECVLFYAKQDIATAQFLIRSGENADIALEMRKLDQMVAYCNLSRCLRRYILAYFGETNAPDSCGNCGNCLGDFDEIDVTTDAQKYLSCVKRMGERYGPTMVSRVLRGDKDERIIELGFDKLSTYGIMSERSARSMKDLLNFLLAEGLLSKVDGEFMTLALTDAAWPVLQGKVRLTMREAQQAVREPTSPRRKERMRQVMGGELFDRLRKLRKSIADEEKVPPFIVFSDATLMDMCRLAPNSPQQFLRVAGVGRTKAQRYGEAFLEEIRAYQRLKGTRVEVSEFGKVIHRGGHVDEESSAMISYRMLMQGLSPEQIVATRQLVPATVEGHLLKAYQMGYALPFDRLLDPAWEMPISEAIAENRTGLLVDIKALLPDEIPFFAVRLLLARRAQERKRREADD